MVALLKRGKSYNLAGSVATYGARYRCVYISQGLRAWARLFRPFRGWRLVEPAVTPTREIPMVESYVDICINGCLELEALYRKVNGSFTKEFIDTTSGWNE